MNRGNQHPPPRPPAKQIQILVCSGNMGNQQPDYDSLAAWIPLDGYCKYVLNHPPKYPLVTSLSSSTAAATTATATTATNPPTTSVIAMPSLSWKKKPTKDTNQPLEDNHPNRTPLIGSNNGASLLAGTWLAKTRSTTEEEEGEQKSELTPSYSAMEDSPLRHNPSSRNPTAAGTTTTTITTNTNTTSTTPTNNPHPHFRYANATMEDQFDLIVIGMQESTFEIKSEELAATANTNTNTTTNKASTSRLESMDSLLSSQEDETTNTVPKDADDDHHHHHHKVGTNDSRNDITHTTSRRSPAKKDSQKEWTDMTTSPPKPPSRKGSSQLTAAPRQVQKVATKTAKSITNLTTTKDHTKSLHYNNQQSPQAQQQQQQSQSQSPLLLQPILPLLGLSKNLEMTLGNALLFTNLEFMTADTNVLHQMLHDLLPSYHPLVSYQRGEMRLIIYGLAKTVEPTTTTTTTPSPTTTDGTIQRPSTATTTTTTATTTTTTTTTLPESSKTRLDIQVLSVKAQNTGRAGLANKGGIVAELLIEQSTRIAICTAHLEAHEGLSKYTTRCSTIGDIFRGTESSVPACRGMDVSVANHFMFFLGDLNFRTRLPNIEPGSAQHVQACHQLAKSDDWMTLNRHDELAHALRVKDCLVAFKTLYCNFPPTFKVLRQDGYTYKENRSPSYTDRILYKTNHQLGDKLYPLAYEPIDAFTSSDHKPIRGAFAIELNPKLKWRPVLATRYVNVILIFSFSFIWAFAPCLHVLFFNFFFFFKFIILCFLTATV